MWRHNKYVFNEDEEVDENNEVAIVEMRDACGTAVTVWNLNYDVDEGEVKTTFERCGRVQDVILHYDRCGRSLGVADVIYSTEVEAERAVTETNGTRMDGRRVYVHMANGQEENWSKVVTEETRKGSNESHSKRHRNRENNGYIGSNREFRCTLPNRGCRGLRRSRSRGILKSRQVGKSRRHADNSLANILSKFARLAK